MKRKPTNIVQCVLIFVIVIGSVITTLPEQTKGIDSVFTLVFKTNSGGVRPDYGNFLKQYCARVGINIDVIVQDWSTFVGELISFRNFDIVYIDLEDDNTRAGNPDMTGVYNEDGSLNLFGYDATMDYNETLGTGKNEWYMSYINSIIPPNSEERMTHYYDWQNYLMDKMCPMLPLFSPVSYKAYWANLNDYNITEGILQSWGKMSWDGLHDGQSNTNELVLTDNPWMDLNPLFQSDSASRHISKQCLDPLIWYDPDQSVWPHLATNYTFINETTISIELREDVFWQDYDTFTDEPFDVDDVFFTFYAWKHLSKDQHSFAWIEDMKKISENQLYIYIDGNPSTPENDPYTSASYSLAKEMLPEHYLNQTQLSDGVTPDTSHESWNTFATNCFGTGLFEISNIVTDVETTLTVNPDSWWINTTINADPLLDWEARFGDFSNDLVNQRIRIISDIQTSLLEFEAGYVDIGDPSIAPEKKDDYILNSDFIVQSDTLYSFGFFGFNMREVRPIIGDRDPCPNDPRISIGLAIRKAICYLVDKNEINAVIHRGENIITYWPMFTKLGEWCDPNIIKYDFNLDEARGYIFKTGLVPPYSPPDDFPYGPLILYTVLPVLGGIILIITIIVFIIQYTKRQRLPK